MPIDARSEPGASRLARRWRMWRRKSVGRGIESDDTSEARPHYQMPNSPLRTGWAGSRPERAAAHTAPRLDGGARVSKAEFDVQGIIGIRVLEPTEADVALLSEQFGTPKNIEDSKCERQWITLRYVRDLLPPALHLLGLNSAGFTDDRFFLLDAHSGRPFAEVSLESVDTDLEVVCESGPAVAALLVDLVTLALMRQGYVWLHASAFVYSGHGILVAGWEKGGKTESLLAFAEAGAEYVADEAVFLSADGREMFGLPVPVAIWQWQLRQLRQLAPHVPATKKLIFLAAASFEFVDKVAGRMRLRSVFPFNLLKAVMPSIQRRRRVFLAPRRIFKQRMASRAVPIDKVFIVMSRSAEELSVEPCEAADIAERMRHSNAYERTRLLGYYRAFNFAFPHRPNVFLDNIEQHQSQRLALALANKDAYRVSHPYPVCLRALFEAMRAACD